MDIFQTALKNARQVRDEKEKHRKESKSTKELKRSKARQEAKKEKFEYPEVPDEFRLNRVYTEDVRSVVSTALMFASHDYEYAVHMYKNARSRLTFAQKTKLIRELKSESPDLSGLPFDFQAAHHRASLAKRAYVAALDNYTVAHWWRHTYGGKAPIVARRNEMLKARGMRL